MSATETRAIEPGAGSSFAEHSVEFHNQGVTLAGSLLAPRSELPLAAVVFIHGAGPQTRESYREAAEYFARQGIAALIYDKRGTGRSGGTHESRRPYENLVKDALAAIDFLKQRGEIAPSQIGVWGLSQGAEIGANAASRSEDIRFVIAPKSYPPPDEYVHPAWSSVDQPVLAMWGQLDQNVPVGESVAGLKKSLALAENVQWTMVILPQANHSLGISETGTLQSKWRGYPPGALKTMTDWIHGVIDDPSQIGVMKQEGFAPQTGVLARAVRYERLRWYGNGIVQTALWILFLVTFLANTIAGVRCGVTRLFRRQPNATLPASNSLANVRRAICALNLVILVAFTFTVLLVLDQLHPNRPTVLSFLPSLGTVSTLTTIALLIVLARTRRDDGFTEARPMRGSFDVLCLVLFVPYMFYWNLIGYHF